MQSGSIISADQAYGKCSLEEIALLLLNNKLDLRVVTAAAYVTP